MNVQCYVALRFELHLRDFASKYVSVAALSHCSDSCSWRNHTLTRSVHLVHRPLLSPSSPLSAVTLVTVEVPAWASVLPQTSLRLLPLLLPPPLPQQLPLLRQLFRQYRRNSTTRWAMARYMCDCIGAGELLTQPRIISSLLAKQLSPSDAACPCQSSSRSCYFFIILLTSWDQLSCTGCLQ